MEVRRNDPCYFYCLQSPRNGEDLSDGEAEVEAGSHDEAMGGGIPRESSPEDGLGGGGQVRVKVTHILKEGRARREGMCVLMIK